MTISNGVQPGQLTRRGLVGLVLGLTGLARVQAASSAPGLPLSNSLPDELQTALAHHQPLVVLVSLDGCPFCQAARQSYLMPLRQEQGFSVVQVDMNSDHLTRDFKGQTVTHGKFIKTLGVEAAPTVLFYGPRGVEIAERLSGSYIPDFYGAYLDQRLAQAQQALAKLGLHTQVSTVNPPTRA